MEIGFCGSGSFAADCLAQIASILRPKWVITGVPRPAGRGMKMTPTPVQLVCEGLGLDFKTTDKLNYDDELINWISENCPDAILVIDFGHIIKEPLLSLPRLGCINIHPSKLPLYRGAAPVQRAIMDDASEMYVSIFKLDLGVDSGPLLVQKEVHFDDYDDASSVLRKCADTACSELSKYLCCDSEEVWAFREQNEDNVTFAPKIEKNESIIDWNKPALFLSNKVRAIGESFGVYSTLFGKRLGIKKAVRVCGRGAPGSLVSVYCGMPVIACGEDALKLILVQPEGKKIQSSDEWLRGSRMKIGDSFDALIPGESPNELRDIVSRAYIYNGVILTLRVDEVKFPSGIIKPREIVEHNSAVTVIVINSEGKICLVSQYRHAVDEEIFELPAGIIEIGEEPLDTVVRELQEEIGHKPSYVKRITEFYTSPGFSDEKIILYLASDLVPSKLPEDDDEYINAYWVTLEEWGKMIKCGQIKDAKTLLAYYWYCSFRSERDAFNRNT